MSNRTALDLDMLAYDIANMIDRLRHPLAEHAGATEIRAALPAFLAALGLGLDGQPLTDPTPRQVSPAAEQHTVHDCNPNRPGQPLPYGRKKPGCPRCDELLAGAAPRQAPQWVDKYREARDSGDARAEEIRRHHAPGSPHSQGACGTVCTAFDW